MEDAKPLRTYGEYGTVRADEQADRKGMQIMMDLSALGWRDKVLLLHYRGFQQHHIVRRLGLSEEDVASVVDGLMEAFDREMVVTADFIREDLAARYMRMIENLELLFLKTGDTKYARAMKELGDKLAKLTGANAPTQHIQKSIAVTVDANQTQMVLNDPQLRALREQQEHRMIEIGHENQNG